MLNASFPRKMVTNNLPQDIISKLETLPIKVKFINTKLSVSKSSSKTVVVDLNQCEFKPLEVSQSHFPVSRHEPIILKSSTIITEGDTYVNRAKSSEHNLTKHSTEHPAVLMHSGYFQDSQVVGNSSPAPCAGNDGEVKPRNRRRRWRRESNIEPVQLTPETTKRLETGPNGYPVSPVYVCLPSKQYDVKSPNFAVIKKKPKCWELTESESSQVLMNKTFDRQAYVRRSKSGQVTGSKKEVTGKASLPKSATIRKKVIRLSREAEQPLENMFGPRLVADEIKTGVKASGSFRKQWSKPSPEPEFRGQEPSDAESAIEVNTKRSTCSGVSIVRDEYNKHDHENDYVKPIAESPTRDGFQTHRVMVSKIIRPPPPSPPPPSPEPDKNAEIEPIRIFNNVFDIPSVENEMRVLEYDDTEKVPIERFEWQAPLLHGLKAEIGTSLEPSPRVNGPDASNPIIYMSEMFKTECLHECGSSTTRNKKLAWPQEVLGEALITLTKEASQTKSAAIQTICRLAAFYPEVAESEQLALVRGLTTQIQDPRPYVSRLALVCLMLLFSRLRFNMIQCLMETCSALIAVLVKAKCHMLKRDIISALNHLPDLVVPQQAIHVLLTLVKRHSEQIVRQTVSRCIVSILERKGSSVVLHAQPALTELVLLSATQFCNDVDPTVKSNGLKIIKMLQDHPNFDVVFKNHVSAETVKMVMSCKNSIESVV